MFREAQSTDFDAIMALYRQLHPHDPPITDGSDRVTFDQILATEWLHLYVLEQDETVIATTYLNLIPNITRSASPYAVIENVVVDETRRGRGHGKMIIAHTLQQAWDAGCYKAMLMTGSRRESTHAFYRACGFSADDKTGYTARPPRESTDADATRTRDEVAPVGPA
ncbi:GNAT family N-acetyltransferase [Actinopolymorpha pittospori]|uniref:N-acetylglutamate synthase-like GNAT family acetyltransferase n=1 Tax=Actinopolymorpha pittospori TaxID=648752 RepID=A0A927R8E9_9ACTN|nr:GNAT family N-acetyltransferase [Actinopolymorpha pittospori]MBE1605299.1 N-acetylglutamate synthase-like GNAT family acetyltransferase [Actinopolymorpha pittospori]